MTHHARRKPREIEISFALDQLFERIGQGCRIAATNQVFGKHPRAVRQRVVCTGRNAINGGAGVEKMQKGAGKKLAVGSVHGNRQTIATGWRNKLKLGKREADDGADRERVAAKPTRNTFADVAATRTGRAHRLWCVIAKAENSRAVQILAARARPSIGRWRLRPARVTPEVLSQTSRARL